MRVSRNSLLGLISGENLTDPGLEDIEPIFAAHDFAPAGLVPRDAIHR